jgi:cytochrome c553
LAIEGGGAALDSFESIRTLAGTKSNTRPGYDASMAEVTQPISDAEILDLAYFMARAQ